MVDKKKREMAERASIMYYEKNYMQNEVAKELGVSRSLVSQLLAYARNNGIVDIKINIDEFNLRMIRKEMELKSQFPHVSQFYIMSSESEDETKRNLGDFAAPYLAELINESEVIGVNLGASVEKAINSLSKYSFPNSENKNIVQIMGGFSKDIERAHPIELVRKLSSIMDCGYYYLNCPAVIVQEKLRSALLKEDSIQSVIQMWDKIDLAIMGIGTVNGNSRLNSLLSEDMRDSLKESHACADVNINYFDQDGRYLPLYENNKISAGYNVLKRIKKKVAICHGLHKKEAILSALKAGVIDVLITDSITVNAIESIGEK
jgi:DNA-binding transcriptional regulator LsrR (DeoR family)